VRVSFENMNRNDYFRFNEQIKYRERRYGKPLPFMQKVKAGRAIAHEKYPQERYKGIIGHMIRQKIIQKLLNSINTDYNIT
jgi:hypothetical protein